MNEFGATAIKKPLNIFGHILKVKNYIDHTGVGTIKYQGSAYTYSQEKTLTCLKTISHLSLTMKTWVTFLI